LLAKKQFTPQPDKYFDYPDLGSTIITD